MSLDGYIAGPNGEADWIVMDPDIDFKAMWDQFDTMLVGGRTYRMLTGGKKPKSSKGFGMRAYVFSRTLKPEDCPGVTVVSDNVADTVNRLRAEDGKDIWLFGGGSLFHSLLEAGVVDSIEVGVIPVLLGEGIPLFPGPALRAPLELVSHKVYPTTGTLGLEYRVGRPAGLKTGGSIKTTASKSSGRKKGRST